MLFKGLVVGLLTAGVLTVAACGGGGDDSKPASNSGASSSSNTPAASASGSAQIIEVAAVENGQNYVFDKSEIRVKPGTVTIRYTNKADNQRPHTFDVKTKDGKDDIIRSDRVDPGKTLDVTFTLSEEGTYRFICLLPGHEDRGQKGTFIVTRS